MQPIGPLMWEHRLIEEMVELVAAEADRLENGGEANPRFATLCADFLRTYADDLHHGKEEDILFARLREREIADEHTRIMDRLTEEHKKGRQLVGRLRESANMQDPTRRHKEMAKALRGLAELYPEHIRTEDEDFFHPVMEYFSEEEQQQMLAAYHDADKQVINDRYKQVVEEVRSLKG